MARARRRKEKPVDERPHLEIVERDIENPMWSRDHDGDRTNPRLIRGKVNVRESAVSVLASKGAIKADQVAAADRFRKLWEAMGGTGARAIDWRREAVDGGRTPDPISAFQIDAGKELMLAFNALKKQRGLDGYKLICAVAGEGRSIHEMAETRRGRDTLTDNLRAGLDVLSHHWGFSTHKRAIGEN